MAIVLFLALRVTSAVAQPTGVDAEALYGQGRDLMAAGKIAEACAAFETSGKSDPAVTTIIALATCREQLGRLASAWELFRMAERQTRLARDNITTQLHAIAHERATKLEPRVSKLTINVSDRSKTDGLEILRDAVSIPAAMWNQAIPIDGGTYTITARVPGAKTWSTTVTLAPEADTRTVDIPEIRNVVSAEAPAVNQPGDKPRTVAPVARASSLEQGGKPLAGDERKKAEEPQRATDLPKRKPAESARRTVTADAARPAAGSAVRETPWRALPPGGRELRIAGLATAAAGVVALGAGVAFGVRARSISAEAAGWDRFDQARFDRGQAAEHNMFILTGAGVAALVAGGVLYYLGHRIATTEDRGACAAVTFAPAVALGEVTFAATGHF